MHTLISGGYFSFHRRDERGLFCGLMEAELVSAAIVDGGMLHGRPKLSASLLPFDIELNVFGPWRRRP